MGYARSATEAFPVTFPTRGSQWCLRLFACSVTASECIVHHFQDEIPREMITMSLGLWKVSLQEHGSGNTSDDSPGSVGDGVGTVDVVVTSSSWAWRSAVGALSRSRATPDSHGDSLWCARRGGSWCRACGSPASLDFSGHGGTDESRSDGNEAHCDGCIIWLKGFDNVF